MRVMGLAVAAAMVVACGKGASPAAELEHGLSSEGSRPLLPLRDPGAPMTDASVDPQDAGLPLLEGDPCMQGEVEACSCEAQDAEGERHCEFDVDSPLDGFFSECEGCAEPSAPDAGNATDAGGGPRPAADAGAPTNAGSGSAGGGGSGGNASAGSGGSASAGSGGAPSVPSPPTGGCMANPSMCSGLLQCCRPDGMCGLGVPGVLCL